MSGERVRAAYAARAAEYVNLLGDVDAMAVEDRENIAVWGDGVSGPVIDAGCGPGHWTAFLRERGTDAEGVDQVPEFIESARSRFPGVPYRVGRLDALGVAAGSLGGLLAWYSVIHAPPEVVAGYLDEFARCLRPGGSLLLGFFEAPAFEPFDHTVVTAYYWPVDAMRQAVEAAGFEVTGTRVRPEPQPRPGRRPHADLLARRLG